MAAATLWCMGTTGTTERSRVAVDSLITSNPAVLANIPAMHAYAGERDAGRSRLSALV